jgi:TPP-dependent pyruvate/acetoin dehydrogenase alpha subunit
VWKLPVIFVCENNLYMEYTAIHTVTAVDHPAADRAAAYGLEWIVVDGNDADEVYRTASKYIDRARKGGGPALIEAKTYRHSGHSRADPAKYRPEGELDKWLERDPLKLYRARLLDLGFNEPTLKDLEDEVLSKVDEATAIAKASPAPGLDAIMKDVWADGGTAWRN